MTLFAIQPAFSRGELSPRLNARVDIEYYKTGLAYCENFYVMRQGGLRKRPGFRYANRTKTAAHTVVRPFAFVIDQSPQIYAIELGNLYARFHTRNGIVSNPDGSPYEITTPWTTAMLSDLQFQQINDELRVTHRACAPCKLRRYGEIDWRILPVQFDDGPYQPIVNDGTRLQPSSNGGIIQGVGSPTTPGLGNVFVSSRYEDPGTPGFYPYPGYQAFDSDGNTEWMAGGTDEEPYLGFTFETPKIVTGYVLASSPREETYSETSGSSTTIYKIPGSLRSPRSWVIEGTNDIDPATAAYTTLDRQSNITGWGDGERRYFTFNNTTPFKSIRIRIKELNSSVTIARPCSIGTFKFSTGGSDIGLVRLTVNRIDAINRGRGFLPQDVGRLVRFLSEDAYWHWLRIIGYINTGAVDAEMHSPPLPSTNSTLTFALGAFGDVPGWPARVGLYQNRMVYARTDDQPQSLWGSRNDDYDNFTTSIPAKDDDGLDFTVAAQGQIQWLLEAGDLLFGTAVAVRSFGPAKAESGLSATNFKQGKPIRTGAHSIPPALTGVASLFVGRLRNTLHEVTYDYTVDSLIAPDVAVLSEHLLKPGVVEIGYAYQPNALLWIVLSDGTLVTMTYEREQKMVALTRQRIGGNGKVKSLCVLPGGDRDEVWIVVDRGGVQTVEHLEDDYAGEPAEAFYVDCGVTYRGDATAVVTGLPEPLWGRSVAVLADGAVEPEAVVSATGSLTLPSGAPSSVVHIGLPYTATATTLRIPSGSRDGSALGRKKVLKQVIVDFLDSGDLVANSIKTNEDPQQLCLRNTDVPMGDPMPLETGAFPVRISDRWGNGGQFVMSSSDPLPCTVLAVTPGFEPEP